MTRAGIAVPTPIASKATRLISRTRPMVVLRRPGPNSSGRTGVAAPAVTSASLREEGSLALAGGLAAGGQRGAGEYQNGADDRRDGDPFTQHEAAEQDRDDR